MFRPLRFLFLSSVVLLCGAACSSLYRPMYSPTRNYYKPVADKDVEKLPPATETPAGTPPANGAPVVPAMDGGLPPAMDGGIPGLPPAGPAPMADPLNPPPPL